MVYIIVLLFLLIIGLAVLGRKYRSPYTLEFVLGKKGAGKSTYGVQQILKHQKKGWICYTDIPCNIPNVRIINAKNVGEFTPIANSLLVLDEVGITMGNRDFKSFTKKQIEWYKLQRHYRVKCILLSQSWDADKKVRELSDSLALITNLFGVIMIKRPIIRGITLTEPTSEGEARIADTLKFDRFWHWKLSLIPKYHRYFDSFDAPERPEIDYKLIGNVYDAIKDIDTNSSESVCGSDTQSVDTITLQI